MVQCLCSCFIIQKPAEQAACDTNHLSLLVLSFTASVISPTRKQEKTVIESADLSRMYHSSFNLSCILTSDQVVGSSKGNSLERCPEDAELRQETSAGILKWCCSGGLS